MCIWEKPYYPLPPTSSRLLTSPLRLEPITPLVRVDYNSEPGECQGRNIILIILQFFFVTRLFSLIPLVLIRSGDPPLTTFRRVKIRFQESFVRNFDD